MIDLASAVLLHPQNAGIISCSRRRETPKVQSGPVSQINQPYLSLGTHPDCVERLWDKLGPLLPQDCRWVVWDRPMLVHPTSAIIFGFATGTVYAIRLDPADLPDAFAAGYQQQHAFGNRSVLDVTEFGPSWVMGKWKAFEEKWIVATFRSATE